MGLKSVLLNKKMLYYIASNFLKGICYDYRRARKIKIRLCGM